MNEFEKLYEDLNTEQRKAVDHLEGPMMVIAGAGTGKTQVIAMRIANILRQTGVDPFNILCLTFTESGVTAMRERLIKILGTAGYYVKVHTFHSFCQEVIEENPQRFVFARELKLLNDLEKIQYVNMILDTKSIENPLKTFGDPYFYRASILQQISNLKRESVSADDLKKMAGSSAAFLNEYKEMLDSFIATHANKITDDEIQKLLAITHDVSEDSLRTYLQKSFATMIYQGIAEAETLKNGKISYRRVKDAVKNFVETLDKHIPKQIALADIYAEYQEGLLKSGRYDFDDMVLFVLRELTQNRTLLSEYQERYPYVLVDEYQDTNAAQNALVGLLGQGVEMPNVFVVGDDDQAIYRFQGANLDNILAFHKMHDPFVQIVTLKRNYRSHQGILDIAESVITKNIHRVSIYLQQIEKSLVANDVTKNSSKLLVFEKIEDELAWLVEEIKAILVKGTAEKEIAILCRTNRQVRQIAEYFDKFELRYRLEAGESIFDVVQIQQLILLLEVISNPLDDVKFFSLMHAKFLNLGSLDVIRVHNMILTEINEEKKRRHYFETIRDAELLKSAKVSLPENFLTFVSKLESWMELHSNVTLPILIEQVVRESGVLEFADKHADRLIILSALKVFIEQVHEFYRTKSEGSLMEFLNYLEEHKLHEVSIPYFMSNIDGAGIRILTAHKSKGLEYDYVFVPQCTDSNWGGNRTRELIKLPPQMVAHDTTILSKQEIEDERRLFYVAITRTKKNLNISFATMNEQGKAVSPSRFIAEIDDLKLEKVEMQAYRGERLYIPTKQGVREKNLVADLVESRLRELRLTATNVNDYLSCPRLFYYRHFLRAPIIKNKYMALGTAVHEAVEFLYRQQMHQDNKQEKLVGKEEMLEVFEKKLWKELAYQKEYEDTLQKGKGFLGKYYDNYIDNLVKALYIEYDFFGDHVLYEEVPLSGKVDMIELIDPLTRQVAFYDFKTGKPEVKVRETMQGGTIWRQMVFYELLASLSGRFSGRYKLKKSVVDFVEPNEEGDFVRKELMIQEDECEVVREEIKNVWRGVNNLEFECISGNASCDICREVLLFAFEE